MAMSIEVTVEVTLVCDECGHAEQFSVDFNDIDSATRAHEDDACERCSEV